MSQHEVADFLVKQGMIFRSPDGIFIANGVQYDLNVVAHENSPGNWVQASLCDHDCTSEHGGYDCSAALSRNQGSKGRLASVDYVLSNAQRIKAGMAAAMLAYANSNDFEQHVKEWGIPPVVKTVLHAVMTSELFEWNCFGGNPELHPDILPICAGLKQIGFRPNLTTTGKRLMLSPKFREEFKDKTSQPALLALSADDISLKDLKATMSMSLQDIRGRWDCVPKKGYGQAQKVLEALWTLKYAVTDPEASATYPPILFNMVVHKGNLRHATEMISLLQSVSSKVIINPYFGQSSFETTAERRAPLFEESDLPYCAELVEYMISEAKKGNPQLTRRLHFWLYMRSIFLGITEGCILKSHALHMLAGYWLWHCGRGKKPPYLQVARGNLKRHPATQKPDEEPGGYMGCFWNAHTVQDIVTIKDVQHVKAYLEETRATILKQAVNATFQQQLLLSEGCGMPRLWFDVLNTEDKMAFHKAVPGFTDNPLIPIYRQQRKLEAGF